MSVVFPLLKILAGIGLFLFAMYLVEESLKNLSGRKFKQFLKRISKHRLGAVVGGAVTTGILQSSSMVSVMVLAFVGTGVFTMRNAMAILLGANLGTTFASWVVLLFGFKYDIEIVAYPMVFIGGLLLIIFEKRKNIKYLAFFLIGFGLLFIGLGLMKTAMESEVKAFDFSPYTHLSLAFFLLIGFVLTLIVQSSSVTMALALTAMHAGVIGLAPAAAIVLGSETGTIIKIFLGAIGSNASKKRVVLGNLLFNIFLSVFAFTLLKPILALITNVFGIKDAMTGLVTFSTLVNLIGLIIFLPFLNLFAKLLERFFKRTNTSTLAYLQDAIIDVPEATLELFKKETRFFIYNSMLFNLLQQRVDTNVITSKQEFEDLNEKRKFLNKTSAESYQFMKEWQGEIQALYLKLGPKLNNEWNGQLDGLNACIRNALHSIKSMNDIDTNTSDLVRSSKDVKYNFFKTQQAEVESLYRDLDILLEKDSKPSMEYLQGLVDKVQKKYTEALNDFYKEVQHKPIEDIDITTIINYNRELYDSNKGMITAVRDFLLYEEKPHVLNGV